MIFTDEDYTGNFNEADEVLTFLQCHSKNFSDVGRLVATGKVQNRSMSFYMYDKYDNKIDDYIVKVPLITSSDGYKRFGILNDLLQQTQTMMILNKEDIYNQYIAQV